MAASKRQQVVDAIKVILTGISGFKSVSEWQHLPEEPRDLPAVTFYDKTGVAENQAGSVTQHTLDIAIDLASAGDNPRANVRSLAGDVLGAFAADRRLGGLLTGSMLTGFDMGFESASLRVCLGNIKLQLTYETDNWHI